MESVFPPREPADRRSFGHGDPRSERIDRFESQSEWFAASQRFSTYFPHRGASLLATTLCVSVFSA
jgi:hypothetical protein